MIRNYFTIALRVLFRHKIYPLINLTGLSIGIASALLILVYISDEYSYDNFHNRYQSIYRATMDASFSGQTHKLAITPNVIVPFFKREFPEIEQGARLYNISMSGPVPVQFNDKSFQEDKFYYADAAIFKIFTFPFIKGNPNNALVEPNSIVLTESAAVKYFGVDWQNANVLEKSITVAGNKEMKVTGIMKDIPRNAHFHFDLVASYNTLKGYHREEVWENANFYSYFLLKEGTDVDELEEKIKAQIQKEKGEEFKAMGMQMNFPLFPIADIHLKSNIEEEPEPQGNISYVYIFSFISLIIVLIACINYMNLATARSSLRSKEIGLRKVLGAVKKQLIVQFLGEAILLSFLACIIALIIDALLLPYFNEISGKIFTLNDIFNVNILITLTGIGLIIGLLAGLYPAVFLSSYNIQKSLKGKLLLQPAGAFLRKGLVVLQFGISIFMVIATVIVFTQLQYFQNKNLGFNKEQFLIVPLNEKEVSEKVDVLKSKFEQINEVTNISLSSEVPGKVGAGYLANAEGLPEGQNMIVHGLSIDVEFIPAMGLQLLQGRNFNEGHTAKEGFQYIINETAARKLGWTSETAIGKWIDLVDDRKGSVIGVVKDFHFTSLHHEIRPLVMFAQPDYMNYMLVKINLNNVIETVNNIEASWHQTHPDITFDLSFLDKEYDALYRTEQRTGNLFGIFSILSILIAILGLIGLAAFTAEQKHKEIGVRKVLGASVSSIVVLLSNEYTILILIAFGLAAPLAWWVMSNWLQNFAYQAQIGWWIYLLAGFSAFAITWITVSYQSIKAAIINPVDSLREE